MEDKPIPDQLSSSDMQKWLQQEIMDSVKAHQLRVRDALEIVTSYAAGKLTPAEAQERFLNHDKRWGEALPGTHAFPGSTDEQIIRSIDAARSQLESFQKRARRSRGSEDHML